MKNVVKVNNNRAGRRLKDRHQNRKTGKIIVLMSVPTPIHSVIASLDMPISNADRGVRAKTILDGCTNNAWVDVTDAKILEIQGHLDLYNSASPSNRKARWRVVKNDLEWLMGLFQAKANDNPKDAVEIINSGKFGIKAVNPRQNQYFHAENTAVSGTVELFAEGGGQNTAHDWWFSLDNITFTRMTPTIGAHTIKEGLPKDARAWFKHQLITKDGPQGFDETIDILVN